MPSSAIAIARTIAIAPERAKRTGREKAALATRAPRTSLIDAEWDAAELASPIAEHRTTLPFPIFVPTLVAAPQAPALQAGETRQTARSPLPPRAKPTARRLLAVGAVVLSSFGVGTGLLLGALAFFEGPRSLGVAALSAPPATEAAPAAAALTAAPLLSPPPAARPVAGAVLAAPSRAPSAVPSAPAQRSRRAPATSRRTPALASRSTTSTKVGKARRTDNPY